MIIRHAFSMLAALSVLVPDPQIDGLKQRIWASFSEVDAAQQALPPNRRATGAVLKHLYLSQRAPVIAELWRISKADPRSQRGLEALGLTFAWGDAPSSQRAVALLARMHGDNDALAPELEAGYGDSTAPDKRNVLLHLAATARSRAVAGSSLYLLAQQVLEDQKLAPSSAERDAAIKQLRRVKALYRDQPTTLLGGGADHRLGAAATALLFQEEHLSAGATVPSMAARDLNGQAVTNASWAGRYTLVDFWATWCPPCVAAFPKLQEISRRHSANLHVVSISADATPAIARAFVKREGAGWDQWYVGPSGRVSSAWSNASYPYFLLVGPDRHILKSAQDAQSIEVAVRQIVP